MQLLDKYMTNIKLYKSTVDIPEQFLNIQKDFNEILKYSQYMPETNTDSLFESWYKAKRKFIELFNGLIYEWPKEVSFELNEKEKELSYTSFIERLSYEYGLEELSKFLQYQDYSDFYSNVVACPYVTSNGITIPKGMKMLKAFKFFVKDKNLLDELQTQASRIIQEDKIEGKLCLSVDPRDYLTVSENNNRWRSCHALDGDYRAGNLSYMLDSSTIICYLKSKEDCQLEMFPTGMRWNNKKWRMLLFFSDDFKMIFAGRQYPFESKSGIDFIREKVLPIVGLGEWSQWTNKKISEMHGKDYSFSFYSPYVPVGPELVKMKDLVKNKEGSLQYNDLLSSTCYDPLYAYKVGWTWYSGKGVVDLSPSKTKFNIGGSPKCTCCGKEKIRISSTMMCVPCEIKYGRTENEDFPYCPICDNKYFYEDAQYVDSTGQDICPSCFSEYVEYCGECGRVYYKEDLIYDEKKEIYLCRNCVEEISD